MAGPGPPNSIPHPIAILEPIDLYGMDYLGPLSPRAQSGNTYVLIGVEYFSRYVHAEPLLEATAANSYRFLQNVAQQLGWPLVTYTDNGSHFKGHNFVEPTKKMGVKH